MNKPARSTSSATQLYRHFDAAGNLLYVGISLSTLHRLSQHKDYSPWFSEIARVEITNFASREEALEAEREAIKSESPAHNIHHKFKARRPENRLTRASDLAEKSRDLITAKIVDLRPVYSIAEVAELLTLGLTHVDRLISSGALGSISWTTMWGKKPRTIVRVSGWQLIDYLESLSL